MNFSNLGFPDPGIYFKVPRMVGRLIVRGNDGFAVVATPGPAGTTLHIEDNAIRVSAVQSVSAFVRACAWAEVNQHLVGPLTSSAGLAREKEGDDDSSSVG